jgi:hypothetical protein
MRFESMCDHSLTCLLLIYMMKGLLMRKDLGFRTTDGPPPEGDEPP